MTANALSRHGALRSDGALAWFTVERVAYATIALVAVGLRLWAVGGTVLTPTEAVQALPAVAAAAGHMPDLIGVSPLLHTLQRLFFTLFGSSEATARFWPALAGGLAPLLFYALRDRLTRGGALVAAGLWAISPVALLAGRLGLDDGLTVSLALALLAALSVWAMSDRTETLPAERRGTLALRWAAIATGLLLASGSMAYTALLALVVAFGRFDAFRSLGRRFRRDARALILAFILPFVLGATFGWLTPDGLAAAASLPGQWLRGLAPQQGEYGAWELLRRLILSEPLVTGFGIVGIIWSIRARQQGAARSALAVFVALVAVVAGRGRHPAGLALVALMLTLFAGPAIARALRRSWQHRDDVEMWILLALSSVLLWSAAIGLPSAANPANPENWRRVYSGVGIVTALAGVLVWVVFGVWGNWRTVVRVAPMVPLLFVGAWTLSQTVALNFDRGAWRQPDAVSIVAAPGLDDLRASLDQFSGLVGGGARDPAIDLVWPNRPDEPVRALLQWELRDYPNLRILSALPLEPARLVITPVEEQPALAATYVGAEYKVLYRWTLPAQIDSSSLLRWLLYRESRSPAEAAGVLLWVRMTGK